MSPIEPSPLLADLLRAGVRADVAEALVDAELVSLIGDVPVVMTLADDNITGRSRVLATPLGPDVPTSPEVVAEVLRAARDLNPDCDEVLFASRDAPAHPDARPHMRYVLAGPEVPVVDPPPGWSVRRAEPGDLDDVEELLYRALVNGYPDATATPDDLRGHAGSIYEAAVDAGAVFVAYRDGAFVGHVTLLSDVDDLTGDERLELFDLYLLPAGSGGGSALTSAAVRAARELGLPLRGHVSGGGDSADAVHAALLAKGWLPDTGYWVLPLGASVGSVR
jgi:GNAT superfamily N-acetyltransferase